MLPPVEDEIDPNCLFLLALYPMGHPGDMSNDSSLGFASECFTQTTNKTNVLVDDSNGTKPNVSLDMLDIFKLAKRRSKADDFKLILNFLNLYVTPFIIAIGLTGNIISFLVFSLTHLKRLSSSIYLAALSVADSWISAEFNSRLASQSRRTNFPQSDMVPTHHLLHPCFRVSLSVVRRIIYCGEIHHSAPSLTQRCLLYEKESQNSDLHSNFNCYGVVLLDSGYLWCRRADPHHQISLHAFTSAL